jgi:hypothetical protein
MASIISYTALLAQKLPMLLKLALFHEHCMSLNVKPTVF